MNPVDTSDLVPDATQLFDGSVTPENFVRLGNGFLWNLLVARARLQPHHTVLDIGSGNGQKARTLAAYLSPSGRYFGFDVVEHGVRWCQQRYARFPNFRFDFADLQSDWYNKDASALAAQYVFPYADEMFDVAFMASVATHLLPDALENYLRQGFRVVKKGGSLLATCYLVNEFNGGRHAVDIEGARFTRHSPDCHILDPANPSRAVAYDEAYLRRACAAVGFVVAEITFGTWSNSVDRMLALQDTILLVKP